MGIIDRFKEIMSANINDILDKMEDPEKMIDQYVRNLENDLQEVTQETASVKVFAMLAKRRVDECQGNVDHCVQCAKRALQAGSEEDARTYLAREAKLQGVLDTAKKAHMSAEEEVTNMNGMRLKLASDLDAAKRKQSELKIMAKHADAAKRKSRHSSAGRDYNSSIQRMEERLQHQMDKAEAMVEMSKDPEAEKFAELDKKYSGESSPDIDARLTELKEGMGM